MTIPNDPLFWLHSGNFRTYNIHVARKFDSVKAAIMLSEISDRYRYYKENNQLVNSAKHGDGWVEFSIEDCKERTWLNDREQRNAIEILEAWDVIEKRTIGQNPKRCFRVKIPKIMELFFGCKIESAEKADSENPPKNPSLGANSNLPKKQNQNCQKSRSLQYNNEPVVKNLYNTPPFPQSEDAAVAADDASFSSSPPPSLPADRPPDKPKLSEDAKNLQKEIEQLMKSKQSTWNAPNSHFLAHQCDILLKGGSTYQEILNVVLWALESKYWASALFSPKSNPGTILRTRFSQWSVQKKAEEKPDKKTKGFGVRCDPAIEAKIMAEFEEGFIDA